MNFQARIAAIEAAMKKQGTAQQTAAVLAATHVTLARLRRKFAGGELLEIPAGPGLDELLGSQVQGDYRQRLVAKLAPPADNKSGPNWSGGTNDT
jgi:hypothetical protein